MSVSKDLVGLLKENDRKGTQGYDTQAEVVRVEGDTVWVKIPGGVPETPVQKTINAVEGDTVQVRVSGGNAWLAGNASAPPTDDATALMALESASIAKTAADNAVQSAATAEQAAQEATATAESVRGIAEQAQEAATEAEAKATQAETAAATADSKATAASTAAAAAQTSADNAAAAASAADTKATNAASAAAAAQTSADSAATAAGNAQSAAQQATADAATAGRAAAVAQAAAEAAQGDIDDLQEWFWHDANGSHVLGATSGYRNDITSSGMNIVETATETSVAEFGANGARVGKTTGARMEIDADGQRFYASDGSTQLANMGFSDLPDPVHGGTNYAPFYTFGVRIGQIGAYSFVEGIGNTASGIATHAEGSDTTASSTGAHAEGLNTTASGEAAHAEGVNTTASGEAAHAEGLSTTASGEAAHAEGVNTTASGRRSHAQNLGTVAAYSAQTAIGKHNDNNQNNAFEIGNGADDNNRSNAFSVAWNGDTVAAGDITDGSGNVLADKANASSLAAVATSGAYSDLTGTPTIPTALADLTSDATHRVVTDADITSWNGKVDPSALATVATTGAYSDLTGTPNLAAVATSGDYDDLSNTPTIPTNTSDLTNDSEFKSITFPYTGGSPNNEITSLATGKWTVVGDITLDKGTHLLTVKARTQSNATGRRTMLLSSNNTADGTGALSVMASDHRAAVNGDFTDLLITVIVNVSANNTKYYIKLLQNSGNTLTCNTRVADIYFG